MGCGVSQQAERQNGRGQLVRQAFRDSVALKTLVQADRVETWKDPVSEECTIAWHFSRRALTMSFLLANKPVTFDIFKLELRHLHSVVKSVTVETGEIDSRNILLLTPLFDKRWTGTENALRNCKSAKITLLLEGNLVDKYINARNLRWTDNAFDVPEDHELFSLWTILDENNKPVVRSLNSYKAIKLEVFEDSENVPLLDRE